MSESEFLQTVNLVVNMVQVVALAYIAAVYGNRSRGGGGDSTTS